MCPCCMTLMLTGLNTRHATLSRTTQSPSNKATMQAEVLFGMLVDPPQSLAARRHSASACDSVVCVLPPPLHGISLRPCALGRAHLSLPAKAEVRMDRLKMAPADQLAVQVPVSSATIRGIPTQSKGSLVVLAVSAAPKGRYVTATDFGTSNGRDQA